MSETATHMLQRRIDSLKTAAKAAYYRGDIGLYYVLRNAIEIEEKCLERGTVKQTQERENTK